LNSSIEERDRGELFKVGRFVFDIKYAEGNNGYRIMQRARKRYLWQVTCGTTSSIKVNPVTNNFTGNFANNLCVQCENKATRVVLAEFAKFKLTIIRKIFKDLKEPYCRIMSK